MRKLSSLISFILSHRILNFRSLLPSTSWTPSWRTTSKWRYSGHKQEIPPHCTQASKSIPFFARCHLLAGLLELILHSMWTKTNQLPAVPQTTNLLLDKKQTKILPGCSVLPIARSGVCLLLLVAHWHSCVSGRKVVGPTARGEAESVCSLSRTAQSTFKQEEERQTPYLLIAKLVLKSHEPNITCGSQTKSCWALPPNCLQLTLSC